MNNITKFFLIISLMGLFLGLSIAWSISIDQSNTKACQDIGFEDNVFRNGQDFCEDKDDNLHYVKMECDALELNCFAKTISIGKVDVLEVDEE